MSDIIRDASELRVVDCHSNGSDNNIGNGDNDEGTHETGIPSSREGLSTSNPAADHCGALAGAANATHPNFSGQSIDCRDKHVIKDTLGHISSPSGVDVMTHHGNLLRDDQELKIDDQEGDKAVGLSFRTEAGITIITIAHAKHECATQPQACAAVLVGWNGQIPRWGSGVVLTYVVCKESFPTRNSAISVETAMETATLAWRGIGATFKQVKRHDLAAFAIVYDDSQGDKFYAKSFFPGASPSWLRVSPLSFSDVNDKYLANILAHEIGHILGLRHEFAQSTEAGDPSVRFGGANPRSVMNYYTDLGDLEVGEKDLEGLKEVYAYDQPVYKGLPVIDISPKLHIFSARSGSSHVTKKPSRRLSC